MARNLPPNPLMAHQYYYQYAQLPLYQWRTYDRATLQYSPHSIIPPAAYYPIYPYADDPYQPIHPQYHIHNDRPNTGYGIYRGMEGTDQAHNLSSWPSIDYSSNKAVADGKPVETVETPPPKDDLPEKTSASTEATEASESKGMDCFYLLKLNHSNFRQNQHQLTRL